MNRENAIDVLKIHSDFNEENSNPEIKDCPVNVISFLAINNLLDEDAVMKYLNNEEEIKED